MRTVNFCDGTICITSPARMAVAAAGDEHTILAALTARRNGFAEPVLVGEKSAILSLLEAQGESVPDEDIIDDADPAEAARRAVALVREGRASFLLKGRLDTGVLLKAVVDRERGLGRGRVWRRFARGSPRLEPAGAAVQNACCQSGHASHDRAIDGHAQAVGTHSIDRFLMIKNIGQTLISKVQLLHIII